MQDFVPDPVKNYVMKGNGNKPAAEPETYPVEEYDIKLDEMTPDELRALARRLLCQCGHVAMMTKEETAQAMMDELAAIALRPGVGTQLKSDINARLSAIDKWMDRSEGKPVQKQMIAAKIETRAVNDPDRLRDAARRIEFLLARPKEG